MLDLSNNNPDANWHVVGQHHHRVYLKLTEGANFADKTFTKRRTEAHAAGLLVGAYHFARPSRYSAVQEAMWFLKHLPKPLRVGHDLRPALDLEDPACTPGKSIVTWAEHWIDYVEKQTGHRVVVYGNPAFLGACGFKPPAGQPPPPLWLAAYGRNDGHEHPYKLPKPWGHAAAHQYTSDALVQGVKGRCDISHVLVPSEIDIAVTK